jgi:hypothetical protein
MSLKDRAVLSDISKAKARGESADAMAIRAAQEPSSSTSTLAVIAEVGPPSRLKREKLTRRSMENTKVLFARATRSILTICSFSVLGSLRTILISLHRAIMF